MKKKSNLSKIPAISKQLLDLYKDLYDQDELDRAQEDRRRKSVDKTLKLIQESLTCLETYNFFYHLEMQLKKGKK